MDFLILILIFYLFKFFFLKIKNLSRVKLTLCHVIVIMSRVTIMEGVISLFLIWF